VNIQQCEGVEGCFYGTFLTHPVCVCVCMLCVNDSRTVDDLHADAVGVMNQLARIIQQPGFGLTRLASSRITRNHH